MKKLRALVLMCVVLSACTLTGCDFGKNDDVNESGLVIEEIDTDGVIDYNDNLVEITANCFSSELGIDEIYEVGTAEELSKAVEKVIDSCNASLKDLEKVDGREGDSSLVDAVLPIVQLEVKYYEKFLELIPFQDIDQDSFTQEQADAYNAIEDELKAIDDEIVEANENLIKVQEVFAKNHGYELEGVDEEDIEENEDNVIYIDSSDSSEEDVDEVDE